MNEIKNEFKEKLNELFSTAWKSGDLEGVKSLLSTPYLKDQINIKKDQGSTLSFVCWHGHLDMVKYFLTSPDIKEKSDILADGDNALSFACT
jgi:hypothetical protein